MKVIYDRPRGSRIKKGSEKVEFNGKKIRMKVFIGLTHWCRLDEKLLDWSYDLQKWVEISSDEYDFRNASSVNSDISNLKQAIRHVKKHDEIPKGTRMRLESNFKGYDIIIIK